MPGNLKEDDSQFDDLCLVFSNGQQKTPNRSLVHLLFIATHRIWEGNLSHTTVKIQKHDSGQMISPPSVTSNYKMGKKPVMNGVKSPL